MHSLTRIRPSLKLEIEFDLGLCRTESPFIPSTFSKPLTVVHAVRTYDSKFREYLEREEIYTSGMGMCSEYRFGPYLREMPFFSKIYFG